VSKGTSRLALGALLAGALALAGCGQKPVEAQPAFWKVEGPDGQQGWLFGTIHSSDRPVQWRSRAIGSALDGSGVIMVEVANLSNESEVGAVFTRLSRTQGLPPLSRRVDAPDRPAIAKLLRRNGLKDEDFAGVETWAAALTLARSGASTEEARNGVDRAVIAEARGKPVIELEGAAAQLGLFDALPEKEQRDLLRAVILEADDRETDLSQSWRSGDMTAIEQETRDGLLADPELREVLFTARNRVWTTRISAAMTQRRRPFVAVGAAHMAGPQGLPAMLTAKGFTVTRVQ
jgi:uncharacterized protein YbaP (TraB family)